MKRTTLVLLAFSISFFFYYSCTDDDTTVPDQNSSILQHFPLEVGNYWVYGHYDIAENGDTTRLEFIDSVIISRDTVIRGNKYFILEGTDYPYKYQDVWSVLGILRDSAGHLVDHRGEIRFSALRTETTLKAGTFLVPGGTDTVHTYRTLVLSDPVQFETPAGIFEAMVLQRIMKFKDPKYGGGKEIRILNSYYAKDLGKVADSYMFVGDKTHSERRLLRYGKK